METVVEHLERLENVTPILALVIQSLIQHIHNLIEIGRAAKGHGRNLGHVGAGWTPGVITSG